VNGRYKLDGHDVVPVDDLLEWARWFETADRVIAKTHVGEDEISTVFLGLDHSYGGTVPALFETMVFGGALDQECKRYASWAAAEAGHAVMVERVRAAAAQPQT
jgi:hypothetical protein